MKCGGPIDGLPHLTNKFDKCGMAGKGGQNRNQVKAEAEQSTCNRKANTKAKATTTSVKHSKRNPKQELS